MDFTPDVARRWDWLPSAAEELESYLHRLMADQPIHAHLVRARCKSISSFLAKCEAKPYNDPVREVTDQIAARIIVYTHEDRERACAAIRDRFRISEDRNPGDERPHAKKGYDCQHFILRGEASTSPWRRDTGPLHDYFDPVDGAEIQVRTVAAHAWAEFEHAQRYKGVAYDDLTAEGRDEIDGLFRDADTHRRALEEAFQHITDRLRVLPTAVRTDSARITQTSPASAPVGDPGATAFESLLSERYPQEGTPSTAGLEFGRVLLTALNRPWPEVLHRLDGLPTDLTRRYLRADSTQKTTVRALDDDLLACFQQEYIDATDEVGQEPWVRSRPSHLAWRWKIIESKVPTWE